MNSVCYLLSFITFIAINVRLDLNLVCGNRNFSKNDKKKNISKRLDKVNEQTAKGASATILG